MHVLHMNSAKRLHVKRFAWYMTMCLHAEFGWRLQNGKQLYMLLYYISLNNERVEAFCIVNTVWFDVIVQISDNTLTNVFKILPVFD